MRSLAAGVAALGLLGSMEAAAATQPPADAGVAEGSAAIEHCRKLTERFYKDELQAVFDEFSDEMKSEVPLAKLTAIRDKVRSELGSETQLLREKVDMEGDYFECRRHARFDKFAGVIELIWYLRQDDRVAGFFVRPVEPQAESQGP
jgi:hypothetical protein